ncbi:MAG: carboxylating nicotinate-nucleotide diphosphorylase [Candidatus Aminicenantes bacterium]|nr:carboxylating nicotinate-nucleotide diphosphorylase [Candidatus Aminicenantes bacterium]
MKLSADIERLVAAALREDMPEGDATTRALVSPRSLSRAVVLAKEDGVLAGIDVAARVFQRLDPRTSFNRHVPDGRSFRSGDILAEVEGRSAVLLRGERTALNFLQRLSGIASLTRAYVEAVAGTGARILDTRKTTPGLRVLEKYAVKMGGGTNHRFGLSDMVLVKDNHLALSGSAGEAVRRARAKVGRRLKIEVEVTDFSQAREAVEAGADMILLDNMTPAAMRKVVAWVGGRVPCEASGSVGLATVRRIASTGVDFISVGKLTHSAPAVDISLEFLGPLGRGRNRAEVPSS